MALAFAFASAAPAHTLDRARAVKAARVKANRLARTKPGETHVHRSRVTCRRSNVHLFLCKTTVSGATLCAASETDCDGPAPFSVPYQISVRLHGSRLRVTARVD
jgi:hypothetical protein